MVNVTVAQLLKSGVHLGHKISYWNPKMFPYLYSELNGIHIIDLIQTHQLLKKTCRFIRKAAEEKKTFLFVGTKPQARNIIKEEAIRSGSFYINQRWYGGLLTNWRTVRNRLKTLIDLEENETLLASLSKKEASNLRKKLGKLKGPLGGIKKMKRRPDIIIIVDQNYDKTAVREAKKLKIPIISILDSNCDPDLADFPIPGNDDGINSIKYIIQALADSIYVGRAKRKRLKK